MRLKLPRSRGGATSNRSAIPVRVLVSLVVIVCLIQRKFEGNYNWVLLDETQGGASSSSRSEYRQNQICNNTGTGQYDEIWSKLCDMEFVYRVDKILSSDRRATARVIQIGAHVGFEENDPLARGMLSYLDLLTKEERQRFQWTFVEPSISNFNTLSTNLANYSHVADLRSVHAGIVADSTNQTSAMKFYSVSETIDPVTGFDSLSNKSFPYWITQISSFSMEPLNFNRGVWRKLGLNMSDYVIASDVPTKRYSDLVQEVLDGDEAASSLVLVLIDTEGFDCPIVNGIATETSFLPHFLVFEDKQCQRKDREKAKAHLSDMGYSVNHVYENIVAHKEYSDTGT